MIDCRDECYRPLTKLESLTDEDGGIIVWFPRPSPERVVATAPQIVDTSKMPRVSLTFFPGGNTTIPIAPWLSIHTDLYLSGDEWHGITLYMGQAPRLEYSPYPVANPAGITVLGLYEEPNVSNAPVRDTTPSPLLLPSPVWTPIGQEQGNEVECTAASHQMTTRSRKRVLEDGEGEQGPSCKRAR